MEFLQEPTFAAFLAIVLSFVVAKIVSFAVSKSTVDVNSAQSSVSEGAAAKEVTLERELTLRRGKGERRVKFVDDVVIRRIDRYEGSENLVWFDDVKEVGEGIVERTNLDEKSRQGFDRSGGEDPCGDSGERESEDKSMDGEKTEMVFAKEGNVEGLETSGVKRIAELVGGDEVIDDGEEIVGGDVVERDDSIDDDDDDDDDDDWEGVERSELEKEFAEAVNYVECGGKGKEEDGLAKLGSDVQMQLYGLHKVAIEGPCLDPQPMPFMVSARAKWNAWQRLGSMSRDVAMEHYMRILSQCIPNWMLSYSTDGSIQRKMKPGDEISVTELVRSSEASVSPVSDSSTSQSSEDKVDAV